MLKYFKKHGGSPSNETPSNETRHSLRSSFCDEQFFGMDECIKKKVDEIETSSCDLFTNQSRLAVDLNLIIKEKNCLGYFVQYLDLQNSLPLVNFYLDIDNFRTSMHDENYKSRCCKKRRQSELSCSNLSDTKTIIIEKDQASEEFGDISYVPELKTICDLSMRKSITDDEKSQIYAETSKKMTECSTSDCGECFGEHQVPCIANESHIDSKNFNSASFTDAINIYKKYLTPSSTEFIELPITILSEISLALCAQPSSDVVTQKSGGRSLWVSFNCFDEAGKFALKTLETKHLNNFLQSTFYYKYCLELIANNTLTISDVLNSESILFYFMEFLEQDGQRNCLDFWIAAINFRKHYIACEHTEESKKEAQTDAMIIYEKYFSLQSETRLCVSDKVRSNVEELICMERSNECDIGHCFDLPLRVVANYLEENYLKSFIETPLFANFVTELKKKIPSEEIKTSVNQSSVAPKLKHRKSVSDCTNANIFDMRRNFIFSLPEQEQESILLAAISASSGSTSSLKHGPILSSPFNIDADWHSMNHQTQHSHPVGLTFGRVNSLGRYERDFDTVDSIGTKNWSFVAGGNKIKNAVRKFVNLPEDKVQEEIAWQVAEMIVNDVTSITMSKDNSKVN